MSLENTIKELKEQIGKAEEEEQAVALVEEPAVVDPEPAAEPVAAEPKAEEPAKEEPKPEPKPEEEERGPARLRREKAAAERRADEAQRENEELRRQIEAQSKQPEPMLTEQPALPASLQELVTDHTRSKAWNELEGYEAQVRASNPDYDAVAQAYTSQLAQSIKMLNPEMSPHQIVDETKRRILDQAASLYNKGYENPALELFTRAKEMGFKAQPQAAKEEAKAETAKEIRPDMDKVAANRAKSAGTINAGGESKGLLTKQAASGLSAQEWMKLPIEERKRLMYG